MERSREVRLKNGEWTLGETHPPSLQDVVAKVIHRRTLLQPMGARGEDDERPMGVRINLDVITAEPISVYLIETCV